MALVRDHDDHERRFQAALHGAKLPDADGRVHGMRQQVLANIKARSRGGHR